MSNADNPSFPDFGKLVPGFDFLQNLTRQAAASSSPSTAQLPNLGGWVAPTLNVEDLDKRIQELKAVQFWLDQNAAALKATIQALELQKMTLATLKGMNFNMADVANAFKLRTPDSAAPEAEPPASAQPAKAKSDAAPAAGVVDPMQWWGALTQQFQTIAAEAMKEAAQKSALDTSASVATGLAKDAVKKATDMATGLAKGMAVSARKTASRASPKPEAKATPKAPAPKTARKPTR